LRKGESPVLPGEEREKEDTVVKGGILWQRESAFLFSGAFKTYTNYPMGGQAQEVPTR
jgi:hypothetical protein